MDDWHKLGQQHLWHPYTQMLTAPPPVPVARAEGVYLYRPDGTKILDGISSWWVNIHGHSHPRLQAALRDQSERLQQVIFAGFSHEPAARLAAELAERVAAPLPRVFFSDDGSTAVEVALKMVYQAWRQRGEPNRRRFIALQHAYHGDTFGAMAAGGPGVFHAAFKDLLFDVAHVHNPYCLHCPLGLKRATCSVDCLEDLRQLLERESESIAGVIVEPMVQAAGGMIVWPVEFLREVRALTGDRGIPLIADEIFTGFGRTGRFLACEHGPVEPDVLCLSKALTGGMLPLSVTMASEELYEAFLSEDRQRTFFHGHSFTANALGCAVALESLRLFEDENRLGRIAELEALFAQRLEHISTLPAVAEVRSIGAIAVMELQSRTEHSYLDRVGPQLTRRFLERGVLLRPLGNVLYFLPPYVITDDEVNWVFDVIAAELKQLS